MGLVWKAERPVPPLPWGFPPALLHVCPLFLFGDLLQPVGGIPHDAVQDTAPGVFSVHVSAVCQFDHLPNQTERVENILIAGFHRTVAPDGLPHSDRFPYSDVKQIQDSCHRVVGSSHRWPEPVSDDPEGSLAHGKEKFETSAYRFGGVKTPSFQAS